jgi:hypothetical protein
MRKRKQKKKIKSPVHGSASKKASEIKILHPQTAHNKSETFICLVCNCIQVQDGAQSAVRSGPLATDARQSMSAPERTAAVAAAYDPWVLPVSDRMLDLIEAPRGAMALLRGLRRQREGGPFYVLVRDSDLPSTAIRGIEPPYTLLIFLVFHTRVPKNDFSVRAYIVTLILICQVPIERARRVACALESNPWTFEVQNFVFVRNDFFFSSVLNLREKLSLSPPLP